MKIGTKSLLFGLHQFAVHPFFVGLAWVKLYHKLPNWKEAVCIVIHDWGYWQAADIDGEEGENHPFRPASWVHDYLDKGYDWRYYELCFFHSRTMAKKWGEKVSPLCAADKLGSALTPVWLMVLMGKLSSELKELHLDPKYPSYRRNMTDYQMMKDFSQHYRARKGSMEVGE